MWMKPLVSRSAPRRTRYLLLAGVLVLAAAIGAAFWLEQNRVSHEMTVVMLDNDDRMLYVTADACGWDLEFAEFADRVQMQPRGVQEGAHCNSMRRARLSAPLGSRTVVDARTGATIPVKKSPAP